MKGRAARVLATWFGCGLVPFAPGTMGSLGALPLYLALRDAGPAALLAAAVVLTLVGTWAATVVARETGLSDPQIVVVDEVCGMLIALSPAPRTWPAVIVAFVAFRVFDMTKPFPARDAERLPGGWGIMIDDVVAGIWAAGLMLALRWAGIL
jgi:phosphatidylglycerophosphatase A